MDETVSFGRIAKELARLPGRREIDDSERRRIVLDLFERAERGEFAENDVLMRARDAQQFEPFLPAYRVAREKEWQKGRALAGDPDSEVYRPAFEPYSPMTGSNREEVIEQRTALLHEFKKRGIGEIPRVRINMQTIFLRYPAVLHYLQTCDLEGAPRVLREWFPQVDGGILAAELARTAPVIAAESPSSENAAPPPSGIRRNRAQQAEDECGRWLKNLKDRPQNKDQAFEDAKNNIQNRDHLSRKAFERQWAPNVPAKWKDGGARKGSRKSPPPKSNPVRDLR
jgi:hypothetical protein